MKALCVPGRVARASSPESRIRLYETGEGDVEQWTVLLLDDEFCTRYAALCINQPSEGAVCDHDALDSSLFRRQEHDPQPIHAAAVPTPPPLLRVRAPQSPTPTGGG